MTVAGESQKRIDQGLCPVKVTDDEGVWRWCALPLNHPERDCVPNVESDTSSNARPDTADDGTNWPEG